MTKKDLYDIIESAEFCETRASKIYDYIMYVAIVLGLIPLMFRTDYPWLDWIDYISCTCFIVDYLLRWYTYDVRLRQKGKDRGIWTYVIYPFTPMAIIDLLTILPTVTPLSESFKVARTLRLLKILRILRASQTFKPLLLMVNVIRKERGVLLTLFTFALAYIFLTALVLYNTEEGEVNQQNYDTFFDALYWATCMLTTVGYGDIYPITEIGRVISMLSSLVGVAIIALPSGVITAGYLEELRELKKAEKKK